MHQKGTIVSEFVLPKVALVDPSYVYRPGKATAYTGIDALAHAVESCIGLGATTMSRLASLEAVRLVARYLPVAVSNGWNVEVGRRWPGRARWRGSALATAGSRCLTLLGNR